MERAKTLEQKVDKDAKVIQETNESETKDQEKCNNPEDIQALRNKESQNKFIF